MGIHLVPGIIVGQSDMIPQTGVQVEVIHRIFRSKIGGIQIIKATGYKNLQRIIFTHGLLQGRGYIYVAQSSGGRTPMP